MRALAVQSPAVFELLPSATHQWPAGHPVSAQMWEAFVSHWANREMVVLGAESMCSTMTGLVLQPPTVGVWLKPDDGPPHLQRYDLTTYRCVSLSLSVSAELLPTAMYCRCGPSKILLHDGPRASAEACSASR